MKLEDIQKHKERIYEIARKHGITRVYVFGSVIRGESVETSDVDFLVELDENASVLGLGGFQYEVQELLGLQVDVIPTFVLPKVEDREFVQTVQTEAAAL